VNRIKKYFQTRESKNGTYSIGITIIVVIIAILANLIIGQLPEKYRELDISSNKIYEISSVSKKLLKGLDQDVKMTVLADKEETDQRIKTFLSKYTGLSSKISVEWIDPVLHPSALTEYNASENSIVVSCEETGKTTTISFDDILVADMSSYYYTGSTTVSEFDGDGQLSSAVNYVTSDKTWKIYRTTGHGESTFSTTVSDLLDKANTETAELNMVMTAQVPDDCDLLLMYAPTTDLSEQEAETISSYLQSGGKVMVLLGDKGKGELPNLESVLKTYGLELADGYIADLQRNYQGNYYYIFPELSLDSDLSEGISSEMVLLINAHGLEETDPARDTITVSSFMETSSDAYAVTEEAQTEGSYILGAVATESIESSDESDTESDESTDSTDSSESTETTESRLTVISTDSMIDSQVTDSFPTLENTTLFVNAITANFDGASNVSIEAKSLSVERNTVRYGGVFSILLIFVVPAAILISGFVVWLRRRKA
jgi:ABC-2 type transport system permease protein